MRTIIDAHIHLDPSKKQPIGDLLQNMDANHVDKALLILNTPEERNSFYSDIECYRENKNRFWLSSGINIHDKKSFYDFVKLENDTDEDIKVKIHPNLFNISRTHIPQVIESLKGFNHTTIIDSFFYGANIECHIGVELGVMFARAYPERKVVMAHSGSLDFLKCMLATRYLPNVFYDYSCVISFLGHTSLRIDMVEFLKRTSNRIMFGSDYPSFTIDRVINEMNQLAEDANLNEEQMNDIMFNNAVKIYG